MRSGSLGSGWPKITLSLSGLGRQWLQVRGLARGKPAQIQVHSLSVSLPQLPPFSSGDTGNLNIKAGLSWMLDCVWLPAVWSLSGRQLVVSPRPGLPLKLFPPLALWRSPCA